MIRTTAACLILLALQRKSCKIKERQHLIYHEIVEKFTCTEKWFGDRQVKYINLVKLAVRQLSGQVKTTVTTSTALRCSPWQLWRLIDTACSLNMFELSQLSFHPHIKSVRDSVTKPAKNQELSRPNDFLNSVFLALSMVLSLKGPSSTQLWWRSLWSASCTTAT